jgi:Tfp pilus assembly protein PilO
MFRTVISIVLIAAAILAIVFFAVPRYNNTKDLRGEVTELEGALQKAADLRRERARLIETYNTFTNSDIEKLVTLLPANVDNVRLAIDIEQLAATSGLILKEANVEEARSVVADTNATGQVLGTLDMNISLLGGYGSFVNFVADLEKSLRMIDIKQVGFSSQQSGADGDNDYYQFTMKFATYWLR